MQTFQTSQMTWNKRTKVLGAEASELNFVPTDRIAVVSHRTGATVEFRKTIVVNDNEGDLAYWLYRPCAEVGVDSLVVFND